MSKLTEKDWVEDFQEFVRSEKASVPEDVTKNIWQTVYRDLNPSAWLVFLKVLGIHSVVGTLSLAICNQFDINPFRTGFSLSDYFMKFGHSTCMVMCGILFVGLSVLLSRMVIRPEELRVFRKNAWLEVFGLSMISIGVFASLGAQLTVAVALLWLLGAMLGGVSMASIPLRSVTAA